MKVDVGAKTDVGKTRQGNEDAYLVQEPLFVVADGMGGHLAGDVASATAIEAITDGAKRAESLDRQALVRLVREANSEIWSKAHAEPTLRGMGTTVTMLFLDGNTAHLAHVGDSRAYLMRAGELKQLTEDHTLVARMVSEGRLRPEQARHHPQRNVITRALGIDPEVDVDLVSLELQPGDRLLLCSDGLSSMTDPSSIEQVLQSESEPQSAADALVDLANDGGGEDNVTVVIVDVVDGSQAPADGADPTGEASAVAASSDSAAPPPPAPPPASAPGAAPRRDEAGRQGRRRSLARRAVLALLVAAVVLGGGYAVARYSLNNSWFIGANEQGFVTIYRGIPEDIAGLDLKDPLEESDLALADLPEYLRSNVETGIKVDSRAEAEEKLANLEERAQENMEQNRPRATRSRG